jgi:predicted GH43/DUF377 family glycosyl hydrolase
MKWRKQGVLFRPGRLNWMVTHAAIPVADRIGEDLYRIYFSGRDESNRSQVGYIEIDLNDPHHILYITERSVLQFGKRGTFDDSGVMGSCIVNYEGKKYLYYAGWNLGVTVPFRNSIGLAISQDDGRTFKKFSEGPILDRSIYDPCFLGTSCVLMEDDIWRMWYLSCIKWEIQENTHKHFYHIKYAESHDGINWIRNGVIAIDFKNDYEYAISVPRVLKEDNVYRMWYSFRGSPVTDTYRIGYAESQDGLNWIRKDEEAGIDVSETGWDSEMICYPFVFDHKGSRYMLYNGNGYGKTGFGLAVLEQD